PRYLYPHFGDLPAGWALRAVPTETGRAGLVDRGRGARAFRIEGAWDTQLYARRPAGPGSAYVFAARLRGLSSPGDDSAVFLSFLSVDRRILGTVRMQSLPKGFTDGWSA